MRSIAIFYIITIFRQMNDIHSRFMPHPSMECAQTDTKRLYYQQFLISLAQQNLEARLYVKQRSCTVSENLRLTFR